MPSLDMTRNYSRALNIALATRHVLHAGDTAHIDNVQGCSSRYIIIDYRNGPINSHVWRIQVEPRCRSGCCRRRILFKCCFCSDQIGPAQCSRYWYFVASRITALLSSIDWPATFLMGSPFHRSYCRRLLSSSSPVTSIFIDNRVRSTPIASSHRVFPTCYVGCLIFIICICLPGMFQWPSKMSNYSNVFQSIHVINQPSELLHIHIIIPIPYRFHLFVLVMGPL